eukprot:TRINITY_DN7673_c0_g2_i2.p1 TRINITY_DN7673_c0_g2~~TRINITY_DN7673_c0_g2_i2.p1  ORF type:complete len:452 (-),score=101.52 TRINITY_DN7673_c0_g2_i2:36-1349(-)
MDTFFLPALLLASVLLVVWFVLRNRTTNPNKQKPKKSDLKKQQQPPQPVQKQTPQPPKQPTTSHPAMVAQVKNKELVHGIGWDEHNNYLVMSTESGLLLYDANSLLTPDRRFYKINMIGDVPTKLGVSSNGFVITVLNDRNRMLAYGLSSTKNKEGKVYRFLREFPGQNFGEIQSLQVFADSKFIMTCAKDTTIMFWNLKGECVDQLKTKQLTYTMAHISPNWKYLAIVSAMTDIRVYRLIYPSDPKAKNVNPYEPELPSSAFSGVEKTVFTRLDHQDTVIWLQFMPDSKRIVTMCRDGTWKLWNLDVDYKMGYTPQTLKTGKNPRGDGKGYSKFCISPCGNLMAAALQREIHFWDIQTGKVADIYSDSHYGIITDIFFTPDGKNVVTSSTDNLVRLFTVPVVSKPVVTTQRAKPKKKKNFQSSKKKKKKKKKSTLR